LIAGYDKHLFGLSLSHLQKDLSISEATVSYLGTIIKCGPIVGLPLLLLADYFGRRAILVLTIIPFSIFTFATAFSNSFAAVAVCQFWAQAFLAVELGVAKVFLIEEMPKDYRGWACGVLLSSESVGCGIALITYGVVGEYSGFWRWMYGAAMVPMIIIAMLRRRYLPESSRFQASLEDSQQHDDTSSLSARVKEVFAPVRQLFFQHGFQASVVMFASLWGALTASAPAFFSMKFLREVHGFHAKHITILSIISATVGLYLAPNVGRASDRLGRRQVLACMTLLASVGSAGYYFMPPGRTGTVFVCFFWAFIQIRVLCAYPIHSALVSEVFPTSSRCTAQGLVVLCRSIGDALGLLAEGTLAKALSHTTHWTSTGIIGALPFVLIPVYLFGFPDTAGVELEEIHSEGATKQQAPAGEEFQAKHGASQCLESEGTKGPASRP
jgi:MFS family permease